MYDILALLAEPFMHKALLAALFAAIACGVAGVLAVQNRLTFLAGGASHAAYGGIGLAFHFQWPILPCTILFSLIASMLMAAVTLRNEGASRDGSASPDAGIGVLWAAGMAFGIILIELTPGYAPELMGFLFGSILAVPDTDLIVMAIFDCLLILTVFCFRQGLWATSLDKDFARTRGLPVTGLYLLLVGITAISVVMLIRIVGLILVLALLTIPPSIARRFHCNLYGAMVSAACFALLFCLLGLALSWQADISSGACIIAVATVAYFLSHIPFRLLIRSGV